MRLIAVAVVTLLGVSLVGCGGGDGGGNAPAVCGSVDTLKASVDKLKDIDLTTPSVSDLESGLTGIQSDLSDVKTDAKSEFSSQLDAAEKSFRALKTSVDAAKANPSALTLGAAGSAVSSFVTDVDKLMSDIEATC